VEGTKAETWAFQEAAAETIASETLPKTTTKTARALTSTPKSRTFQ
jgi:hypothetical protein